uniref:Scm like with four mbt domains 2 n=1 Tax=Nothobranchius furzeri TaxID=105023 RepID=A0A8C6KSJ5_NOTFU
SFNNNNKKKNTHLSPFSSNLLLRCVLQVEISLQSSFQPGMKLEVANKSNPETYWVATIITTCGQLLLLRYSGYGDDRKADFWCDVMTAELHPVGWCAQNSKTLMPPEAIKEKYGDWREFLIRDLTGSRTAPANLLEGPLRGKNTVDLIVEGSFLELQDASEPFVYWPARVIRNIGGRLLLRHVGLGEEHQTKDIWLFYLDIRLRPLGWAQENSLALEPPTDLRSLQTADEWQRALENARLDGQKNPLPLEVFKDHVDLPKHSFRMGMKLEMVSPWEPLQIRPVSVTKVYSEIYFQLTLDDLTADAKPRSVVCHANSPGILPVQWCLKNGVALEKPRGYEGQDFDWADYLKQSASEAAPDACFPDTWQSRSFAKDMWLEAVNPQRPAEVCVAQITRVRGRLLWLRLEGVAKPLSESIVDVESMDIFPVGWCEANAYPLTPPLKPVCQKQKKIAVLVNIDVSCFPSIPGSANGRYCCSKIFVNHRCFSGPYLNKGRIAELPQAVGPGKCSLVLKELLSMLINAAYKPGRVLKELQELEDQSWDSQEETLKANCFLQDSDEGADGEEVALQSGSEGTSSEPCDDHTDASSVEVTSSSSSSRPRRAAALRRAFSVGNSTGSQEASEGRRRSTRSLSASHQNNKNQTPKEEDVKEDESQLVLDRNPLGWSVDEVVQFITSTDCASLATVFREQDIDGQALLLLTLPTVQECMDLKLGPAIKLCHQIERVKVAFYKQFAN